MRRLITTLAVLAVLALQGCAVLTPDYSNLRGVELPPGDLTAEPVPITLSVFADFGRLQYVCNQADQSNAAAGPLKAYAACAIHHAKGCALAFWTSTSFEHLGHEALHCFAKAADAAKRAALPAHFGGQQP